MLPLALIAALGTTGAALSNTAAGPLAAISAIPVDLTVGDGMELRYSDESADTLDALKPSDRVSVG